MIAEAVLTLIFLWLLYWIDLERKLNGRPGIPFLGVLFDSVQINVSETFNDKSIRGPPPSSDGPSSAQSTLTDQSVKAPLSRPLMLTAMSPDTVSTEIQHQKTPGTGTTINDATVDNGQLPSKNKKKKKRKKHSRSTSRSKESKHKKRTRQQKQKSDKNNKTEKNTAKDFLPNEDTSIGTDS